MCLGAARNTDLILSLLLSTVLLKFVLKVELYGILELRVVQGFLSNRTPIVILRFQIVIG